MSNFEKPPINQSEVSETVKTESSEYSDYPEKLITSEPKLRYINKSLELLRPEVGPDGKKIKWTELYKNVGPYESALELSDNVREVIRSYAARKIPSLKEKIPSVEDLPDEKLLEAFSNNWFEEISEETSGQRREVLLSVITHLVKKIETHTYQKLLEEAEEADLEKLALKPGTRDLLIKILDASVKASPLFIRFLAYSQLSGKPSEKASGVALFLPGDQRPHTIAELFPHETQFIAKRFSAIAEDDKQWIDESSGKIFKEYLAALSRLYGEKNPEKAAIYQADIDRIYKELISSDFPIVITSGTEGYYKEPYFDPELKISLATPDSKKEEADFIKAQSAMADSLSSLGVEQFGEKMRGEKIRVVNVLGAYGVNLVFNAVAQEKPAILLYLNEQIRAYDRNFPKFMKFIKNTDDEFSDLGEDEKISLMQKMSRTATMLHEFCHSVYPDESQEAKRLGRKPLTIIDEVKAEIVHKALISETIEKGGLPGTEEQWSSGLLASSIQMLEYEPSKSAYWAAAVYPLNNLFEKGIITFQENRVEIKDFEKYNQVIKSLAKEVISLYEDETMTERKAEAWLKKRCAPNENLKKLEKFLKNN